MSKTRVSSSYVHALLRKMGANKKRNLRAYKVVVDTESFYFEEGQVAHSFAARRTKINKCVVKVFENMGNEQYVLLATYEFDAKARKELEDEMKFAKMPQTWVAKGESSVEAWAFALTHPKQVATIVRQK